MARDLLLADLMLDSGLFRVGNTHLEPLPKPGEDLRRKQLAEEGGCRVEVSTTGG